MEVTTGKIYDLKPWQTAIIDLKCGKLFDKGTEYNLIVIINPDDKNPVKLHGKITPVK